MSGEITMALHAPSRYQLAVDQASAYLDKTLPHTNAEETTRWMVEGLLIVDPPTLDKLVAWLLKHERDIASPGDWEDYGMLKGVFAMVIGREANG